MLARHHGELMDEEIAKRLALAMAVLCVRSTCIENIHAGKGQSEIGDFSDVKVVTPKGEIPWNEVSRISDDEMREFMKEVVNKLYTYLLRLDDRAFVERMNHLAMRLTRKWDAPQELVGWFTDELVDPETGLPPLPR